MHEASIAQSMLELIQDQCGGVQPLTRVKVRLGTMSGVCPDALDFAFPEISEAMGFGRPVLTITVVPAIATCKACSTKYDMKDAFTLCPECNAMDRHLAGGDDCFLESVELE